MTAERQQAEGIMPKDGIKSSQKAEMTIEQLVEKWGYPYAEEGWKMEDRTEELLADLRSVIRGKLMEFAEYYNRKHYFEIDITHVDEFLGNNQ
jgi:hypothetical protein